MPITLPTHFPVTCHTDFVGKNSIFVAIKGYKNDGIEYIPLALQKGATTIVVQQSAVLSGEILHLIEQHDAQLIKVENSRLALAQLSASHAGWPANKLRIIGITGTKGKTTTSFLVEHILKTAGYRTALLSTVHNKIDDTLFAAPLTTAQPDYLHQFLKLCVDQKIDWVVMEIAAQALSLHRTDGLQLDGIIFTNFSQEHAEFYASQDDYFQAKKRIFDLAKPEARLIINADDSWCLPLIKEYSASSISLENNQADFFMQLQESSPCIKALLTGKQSTIDIDCPALLGRYNAYNIAAACAMVSSLGVDAAAIAKGLKTFDCVPGRMQRYVLPNGALSIIDYAHNPSSFEQILSLLRSMTDQLIVVFGAGGDRDKTKRPVMGAIASRYADIVILTMDNPRSEDPQAIIQDILAGISQDNLNKVNCILDRQRAIEQAYTYSKQSTIIALLGKGPDEYQIIGTTKIYFSESKILQFLH